MLRLLLGEREPGPQGAAAEALKVMERFSGRLRAQAESGGDRNRRLRTCDIWTRGLIASLEELDESRYAARYFGDRVKETRVSRLADEELVDYRRYVYFYKNAFIRLFSLLDKLGTLMNSMLHLETEKLKPYFSYFTVLRGMRQRGLHPALSLELNALKEKYEAPLAALRKRRNTEIHYMNAEMEDDLLQLNGFHGVEARLEDISAQLEELDRGCRMAAESLTLLFRYASSSGVAGRLR